MSEITRVDFDGRTLIDIAPAKQNIISALAAQGVDVPADCVLDDVAALILAISHNVLKQEIDGTAYWVSQPEIAAGKIEQRFNE